MKHSFPIHHPSASPAENQGRISASEKRGASVGSGGLFRSFCCLMAAVLLTGLSMTACKKETKPPEEPPRTTQRDPNLPTPSPSTDFSYTLNESNSVSIVRYNGTDAHVVIPEKLGGRYVTEITGLKGEGAFENCTRLESVVFPTHLVQIGKRAFANCNALKEIRLSPVYFNEKSEEAFFNSGLERVVLEEGITAIPKGAFAKTQLREVSLPKSVKFIGDKAFAGCWSLERITLGDSLEVLEPLAFYGTGLKEIILPETLTSANELAFFDCRELTRVCFEGDAVDFLNQLEELDNIKAHFNPGFTVYYHAGAKGFTSPKWKGYPTALW